MPTCENCHNKWTWKETIKKSFTLFSEMTCPYCGETQYQIQKSKGISFLPTLIILLPLLLNSFFDIPGMLLFSLFPILIIVMMFISPFFIEISNTDEFGNKP